MLQNEEGWLHNIHLFAQLRAGEVTMTEYEVKFYEAACEMMEKVARYQKLVIETAIKDAEAKLKNE